MSDAAPHRLPAEHTPASLDRVENVLVPRGGRRLHVPDEEGPLCATHGTFRRKSLAVFPEAHRNWCGVCRELVAERGERSTP